LVEKLSFLAVIPINLGITADTDKPSYVYYREDLLALQRVNRHR
jgi:hypothetical protein